MTHWAAIGRICLNCDSRSLPSVLLDWYFHFVAGVEVVDYFLKIPHQNFIGGCFGVQKLKQELPILVFLFLLTFLEELTIDEFAIDGEQFRTDVG